MSEPPISRGFRGLRGSAATSAHVPPGQHLVTDFPVLSAGPTPEPFVRQCCASLTRATDFEQGRMRMR